MGDWTDVVIAVPAIVNLAFAFAFGACAGSFIHVLVHRMPQGLSVISPPSRCPTCGHRLAWHENVPIVSWLRLRGRCSACGTGIPSRYVWSEVGVGVLFALAYAVLLLPRPETFWFPVGEGWWREQGAARALPALLAVWCGLGALVAMTVVDARSYLIPVAIPAWTSILAFVLWPAAAIAAKPTAMPFPLPAPTWPVALAVLGGLAGLAVSWSLLRAGVLPRSFADWGDYAADDSDVFADYPHARREMVKEIAFLGPPVLLAVIGWSVSAHLPASAPHPAWFDAFLSVATGFLVGGAIVWALRIVATILLDTEALGLGDVHLLACVGAVFGWRVAVAAFVIAPFAGLAWWLLNAVRSAPTRMPYGPSLAVGAVAAWGLKPVVGVAVTAGLGAMATAGTHARNDPADSLGLSIVLAVAATVAARLARRHGGVAAGGSIVLMVAAVVSWILSAPSRPALALLAGLVVVGGCVAGSLLCGASAEEGAGPRTALSRILRLLAVVVMAVGILFAVAGPPAAAAAAG
jgi:leader peptidase (prepilin peptidase)/N-methyltransferase